MEFLTAALFKAAMEPATENAQLTKQQFDQVVENLIYVATANGILAQDALEALAKALGTLSAFAARREGLPIKEVLSASQDSVSTFAMVAESLMNDNPDFDPAQRPSE